MRPHVFLGGSCNPTTWRRDIAKPMLDSAGVSYYDPQVEDWSPELVEVEARAKTECREWLFVLDGQTRAVASMIETTELMSTGRTVWLVVTDIPDGTEIAGAIVTGRELADLNNARAYLRDVARRHHVALHSSVEDAVGSLVRAFECQREALRRQRTRNA